MWILEFLLLLLFVYICLYNWQSWHICLRIFFMFVTYVVLKTNRISPPGGSMTAATCWGAQKMLPNFRFIVKQWRGHPMRFNRCTSVSVLSPASYTCGFANAFLFCIKTTFPNSRWLPVSITAQSKLVEVIAFFPSAFPFILSAVSCYNILWSAAQHFRRFAFT